MDDERVGIKLEAEWEANEAGAKKAAEKDAKAYNEEIRKRLMQEREAAVNPTGGRFSNLGNKINSAFANFKNPIKSFKDKQKVEEYRKTLVDPLIKVNRDIQGSKFRKEMSAVDSEYATERTEGSFGYSLLDGLKERFAVVAEAGKQFAETFTAAEKPAVNLNNALEKINENLDKLKGSKFAAILTRGTDAAAHDASIRAQRARLEELRPSAEDYTNAAKEMNRGRWTAEQKQIVRDARERISLYNQAAAALAKLEKDEDAPTGGLFGKKFIKAFNAKMGILSDKNSIFDKKTVSGNGLLSALSYRGLRGIETGIAAIRKPLKSVSALYNRFGRRLKARLITNAVKAVIRLAKEGLKNLDQYSQHLGTPFHQNVQRLSSSLLYLKNAFAAMVGPIVNALTPALERLMDMFANLANHVGAFFAAITGQNQFSAALKKTVTETKNAAGKLKDILAFDELNRLSGDTGGDQSVDEMFEEWGEGTIFDFFKQAIENGEWELIGETLADRLNGIVEKINTNNLGKKLGEKIDGAIKAAKAFVQKADFKQMGEAVATWFKNVTESVSWQDLGELIFGIFSSAIDFFAGMIGNLPWGSIARSIGDMFTGIFNGAAEWIRSIRWSDVGTKLVNNLVDFFTNLPLGDLIESAFNLLKAVAEGAIGLVGGILGGILELLFPGFNDWFDNLKKKIIGWMPDWLKKIFGVDNKDGSFEITGKVEEEVTAVLDSESKGWLSGIADKLGISSDNGPLTVQLGGAIADWIKKILGIEEDEKVISEGTRDNTHAMKSWGPWLRKGNTLRINSVFAGGAQGAGTAISGGSYVEFAASGGTFDKGQLFIANEAGPELIGNVGGKSTVTNQEQFTQGLIDANAMVVEAVMQVVAAVNNKDFDVYMDSQKVGQSVTQYQNNMARRFGY